MKNLNISSNFIDFNYIEQFEDYLNQGFNKILVIKIYKKGYCYCIEFIISFKCYCYWECINLK
jgi:hypothetical protein